MYSRSGDLDYHRSEDFFGEAKAPRVLCFATLQPCRAFAISKELLVLRNFEGKSDPVSYNSDFAKYRGFSDFSQENCAQLLGQLSIRQSCFYTESRKSVREEKKRSYNFEVEFLDRIRSQIFDDHVFLFFHSDNQIR